MITNIFAGVHEPLPNELFQTILAAAHVHIERIVSHGHASPAGFWYDQEEDEWVIVLQGAARLQFENEIVELKPGDFVNIPAHHRHRVEWTAPAEPTIWLAVHYGDLPSNRAKASDSRDTVEVGIVAGQLGETADLHHGNEKGVAAEQASLNAEVPR